jgi:hypothetical protein
MKNLTKSLPSFALVKEGPNGGFQGETPPLTYNEIVDIFGKPAYKVDGIDDTRYDPKISTMWFVKFSDGTLASIYDFQATSLFSNELPAPNTFRKIRTKYHVGGDFSKTRKKNSFDAHILVLATIFSTWPKERIIRTARDARATWVAPYFLSTSQVIAAARIVGKDYPEFSELISHKGGYVS